MKKISKKLLCVLLCVSVIFGGASFSVGAEDTSDKVSRVSCTFNGDSRTSRGFCWFTNDVSASDVQIVKTSEFTGSFDNAKTYSGSKNWIRNMYSHKVTVSDLSAGTEYTYRVGDADKNLWSENGTFRTDDGDNQFSFITIADVQSKTYEEFTNAACVMRKAMETLPASDFTVNLGDFVNDDTNEEWDNYFNNFAFANMSSTLAPVAGNHDGNVTNKLNINVFNSTFNLSNESTDSSTNWVNGVYYSFDYGNAHFAVLNTNDMYPMTQSQRNWLINDMKQSDADWKIVLMHRALYSEGKNINKPDTIIMRKLLIPLFDELDIDMIYAGHDHCYYRSAQVENDRVVKNVSYVTENYKGEEIEFAVNPEGIVNILPSTAGAKRYTVHDAIDPIGECCAFRTSTRDLGGCFLTTTIDGDKLIVKSYAVNDETKEVTQFDQYAIKKDIGKAQAQESDLPTGTVENAAKFPYNFADAILNMLYSYIAVLLPQAIKKAFVTR